MADTIAETSPLLAPISAENPCGPSLRWDPVWGELQQLRRTKTDPFRQVADEPPNWQAVVEQTAELLSTRSKDLMLAAWFTDASLHCDSFAGLSRGLQLLNGLIERYWDSIHPLTEGEDLEQRLAPLEWLTDNKGGAALLPTSIKQAPLLGKVGDDVLSYLMWEGRRAKPQVNEKDADTYASRVKEAARKEQVFDQAGRAASATQLTELHRHIAACEELVKRLDDQLTQRCGKRAPGWAAVRTELENVQRVVRGLLPKDHGAVAMDPITQEQTTAENDVAPNGVSLGSAHSRREAVRRLEEAAAYFSASEPHSPVGYLVRRAIRWANLPFEQLLGELLKAGQPLDHVRETLGLSPPGDPPAE